MASRRSLFAGSAIMLLDAPAALAKAPNPDAELLALFAEHDRIAPRKNAIWATYPYPMDSEREAALDAIHIRPLDEREAAIRARICEIGAKTPAGLMAWLAWLSHFDGTLREPVEEGTVAEIMTPLIFQNAAVMAHRAAGTGSA